MVSAESSPDCYAVLASMVKQRHLVYLRFMIDSFVFASELLIHFYALCSWPVQSLWSCWVNYLEPVNHFKYLNLNWHSSTSSTMIFAIVSRFHHFPVIFDWYDRSGRATLVVHGVSAFENPWPAMVLEVDLLMLLKLCWCCLLPRIWRSSWIFFPSDFHLHCFDFTMLHLCKMDNSDDSMRINDLPGPLCSLWNSSALAAYWRIVIYILISLHCYLFA